MKKKLVFLDGPCKSQTHKWELKDKELQMPTRKGWATYEPVITGKEFVFLKEKKEV